MSAVLGHSVCAVESILFDALVEADGHPLEQERIVFELDSKVRKSGYLVKGPLATTSARTAIASPEFRKRVVDAICSKLAQRRLFGNTF